MKRAVSRPDAQPAPVDAKLMEAAEEARSEAAELPPGTERDELLRKARRSETAAHANEWANSSGLKPPT